MSKKPVNQFLRFIYLFWLIFFIGVLIAYFFFPEFFFQATNYQGPGSPFINTPVGQYQAQ